MVNRKLKSRFLLILFTLTLLVTSGIFHPVLSLPSGGVQYAQFFGVNRYQALSESDRFYKEGDIEMVRQLQREVKPEFVATEAIAEPMNDPEQLEGAPKVYWRLANEGMEQGLESKIFEPLAMLTEQYPDFVPGHLLYVEAVLNQAGDDPEAREDAVDEAAAILERLTTLYPELKEPLDMKIALLVENKRYLEASITARQFSISYPDDPDAGKYLQIAEENSQRYKEYIETEIAALGIATAITGGFTRNQSSVDVISLLLQGEAEAGAIMAEQYKAQLQLVEDPAMVTYIDGVGQKIAHLMGRDEFEYEFFIMNDPSFNAFALPGGKVFISMGALKQMYSEAELAGLLGHEIAHSVLSHSYQKMATNATLDSFGQLVPFGKLFTDLGSAEFSRELETQSDVLGTRAIAASGYSADGLHSTLGIIQQLQGESANRTGWFDSHPASAERVAYLETMIQRNGYERFAYEGVDAYQAVFHTLPNS